MKVKGGGQLNGYGEEVGEGESEKGRGIAGVKGEDKRRRAIEGRWGSFAVAPYCLLFVSAVASEVFAGVIRSDINALNIRRVKCGGALITKHTAHVAELRGRGKNAVVKLSSKKE